MTDESPLPPIVPEVNNSPAPSLPPTSETKNNKSNRWIYTYPPEIHKSPYLSLPPTTWERKNNRSVGYIGSVKCHRDSPLVRRYYREIQESDGFDITPFSRFPRSTILSVIPSPGLLRNPKDVTMLKKHATKSLEHLKRTRLKWKVEKIVNVNVGTGGLFSYYITFTAKPSNGGQPRTFEAKVIKCHGREVKYPIIRLKQEMEKKEETVVDMAFLSNLSRVLV